MGPSRLDAYLSFEVEELIRSLVNGVNYDKVTYAITVKLVS